MQAARLVTLSWLRHRDGHCWVARLPSGLPRGDSNEDTLASGARLFEDGYEIGPSHVLHAEIAAVGGGRFSHWGDSVLLSASDNTRAGRNRRTYALLLAAEESDPVAGVLAAAAATVPGPEFPERRFALAERVFRALVPGQHVAEFGRSFFFDRDFAACYEPFAEDNYHAYDRRYALNQFARLAARLPGDFAECGVYRGGSAFLLARALGGAPADRRLHLFDSFAGLSSPEEVDGSYWHRGDMAVTLDEVRARLASFLLRIDFHPGWIPTRFCDVAERRFALVHIDVDLHQPTADAVAFFYQRLVDRGILVFDDYGFETCPGARRAIDEFFADKPEPVLHLPTGQGVVIRQEG
jgi:hypothetical protein